MQLSIKTSLKYLTLGDKQNLKSCSSKHEGADVDITFKQGI